MKLGEIIDRLKKEDDKRKVEWGFGAGDSYRGYYDRVAFEPKYQTTIKDMLEHAESMVNRTCHGYKGGEYLMTLETECHLAAWGECAEDDEIEEDVLERILANNSNQRPLENNR